MDAVAGDFAGGFVAGRAVRSVFARRVRLVARARVEVVRCLDREGEVGATNGLDLRDAVRPALPGRNEAIVQRLERALDQRHVQVALVLEVDVEQGAAQASPAGHLVHRDGVPARLGIQGLGRIDDFGAAAVLFFLAAFGEVRHG